MKKIILSVVLMIITFTLLAEQPTKFLGIWESEDGKAIYEIYIQENHYHVKLVWVEEDAKQKQKNNLGKVFIENLEYSPVKGCLINGSLKHEKRKINCKIESDEKGNLNVTFKVGIVKRTKKWMPATMRTTNAS